LIERAKLTVSRLLSFHATLVTEL